MLSGFNSNQISVFFDNVEKGKYKFINPVTYKRVPKYEGPNREEYSLYLPDEDCTIDVTRLLGSGIKNINVKMNCNLMDSKYVKNGENSIHYVMRKYGIK